MQAVDQDDHLPGRRVDEADVRRIEPSTGERADRHRLILAEGNDVERLLALARILGRAVPHPDVICARAPFLVLRPQSDHRAALRADEIFACYADRPAEPRGHADDLVGGMDRGRAADLRDRGHLVDRCKHLQPDHRRLEPKQVVEVGHHGGQIESLR